MALFDNDNDNVVRLYSNSMGHRDRTLGSSWRWSSASKNSPPADKARVPHESRASHACMGMRMRMWARICHQILLSSFMLTLGELVGEPAGRGHVRL